MKQQQQQQQRQPSTKRCGGGGLMAAAAKARRFCALCCFLLVLLVCSLVQIWNAGTKFSIAGEEEQLGRRHHHRGGGPAANGLPEAPDVAQPAQLASDGTAASTSSTSSLPLRQLETFLRESPTTSPGARFVQLLRAYLHFETGAEAARIAACKRESSRALCFAGLQNYRMAAAALEEANNSKNGGGQSSQSDEELEKRTPLALWETVNAEGGGGRDNNHTVYSIRRYRNTTNVIAYLGTQAACLPLMLAGSVIDDPTTMVVELGPFAGLSSKCILAGMLTNGVRQHAYRAFDSFDGKANYNAIRHRASWVPTAHPAFTERNMSFLELWKDTCQYDYPTADATAGWITPDSLRRQNLHNKTVSMLSIDSAKSAGQLKSQLGGLDIIEKGTIIFLMDFEFVRQQVKQVYACLRPYLLPVYVSWGMEHWAWIAIESFALNDSSLAECYRKVASDPDKALIAMEEIAKADLLYLSGLTDDAAVTDTFTDLRNTLQEKIVSQLRSIPEEWTTLAAL